MSYIERKSISFVRVFATILILCCHLLPKFNSSILQISGQFFNVGVYIFLILSGFLYGKRKITDKITYKQWITKRAKRILIPMYLFLIILFTIYIIRGIKINTLNWIVYIFNLQAMEIYLNGAEHLWYLTIAMFCYFVTIPLDMYREKFNKKNISFLLIIISITQIIISYFIYKQLGIYLLYMELYIVAYMVGMYWDYEKINIKYFLVSGIVLSISVIIRIIGRSLFDETILYNIMIVGYTQSFIGFSLFFIGFYFINIMNDKVNFKILNYFDSISYEVYLIHYMFIVGPISLINITNSMLVNCAIILIVTLIAATILHSISGIILNFIDSIMNKSSKTKESI